MSETSSQTATAGGGGAGLPNNGVRDRAQITELESQLGRRITNTSSFWGVMTREGVRQNAEYNAAIEMIMPNFGYKSTRSGGSVVVTATVKADAAWRSSPQGGAQLEAMIKIADALAALAKLPKDQRAGSDAEKALQAAVAEYRGVSSPAPAAPVAAPTGGTTAGGGQRSPGRPAPGAGGGARAPIVGGPPVPEGEGERAQSPSVDIAKLTQDAEAMSAYLGKIAPEFALSPEVIGALKAAKELSEEKKREIASFLNGYLERGNKMKAQFVSLMPGTSEEKMLESITPPETRDQVRSYLAQGAERANNGLRATLGVAAPTPAVQGGGQPVPVTGAPATPAPAQPAVGQPVGVGTEFKSTQIVDQFGRLDQIFGRRFPGKYGLNQSARSLFEGADKGLTAEERAQVGQLYAAWVGEVDALLKANGVTNADELDKLDPAALINLEGMVWRSMEGFASKAQPTLAAAANRPGTAVGDKVQNNDNLVTQDMISLTVGTFGYRFDANRPDSVVYRLRDTLPQAHSVMSQIAVHKYNMELMTELREFREDALKDLLKTADSVKRDRRTDGAADAELDGLVKTISEKHKRFSELTKQINYQQSRGGGLSETEQARLAERIGQLQQEQDQIFRELWVGMSAEQEGLVAQLAGRVNGFFEANNIQNHPYHRNGERLINDLNNRMVRYVLGTGFVTNNFEASVENFRKQGIITTKDGLGMVLNGITSLFFLGRR